MSRRVESRNKKTTAITLGSRPNRARQIRHIKPASGDLKTYNEKMSRIVDYANSRLTELNEARNKTLNDAVSLTREFGLEADARSLAIREDARLKFAGLIKQCDELIGPIAEFRKKLETDYATIAQIVVEADRKSAKYTEMFVEKLLNDCQKIAMDAVDVIRKEVDNAEAAAFEELKTATYSHNRRVHKPVNVAEVNTMEEDK